MASIGAIPVRWIDPVPISPPQPLLDLVEGRKVLAELLTRQGVTNVSAARAFLDPAWYNPAASMDLADLLPATERLERAITSGEIIGVWGDFDVDGQTSTTLLVSVLRGLGAAVQYHIPVRARESHGVNLPSLRAFLDVGVRVLLTCDTGITAHEAAGYARSRGVDMVITDHHGLPNTLPDAYAVVNPQRLAEGHPLRTLSGVGAAYLLAAELAQRAGRPDLADAQLDLVALGTVADLAYLVKDTRYLVQRGLALLRANRRLGLQALLETSETRPDQLSAEHISFNLAPRLNAIGRLGDANPVVEFLTTTDPGLAKVFAEQLEGMNARRKTLTDQVFRAAQFQIEQEPQLLEFPALVLAHAEWPAGVVGIVASRLVELYHKPVVLLCSPPGELARGSARSIEGVHITAAIRACQDLLAGFGGHPMAAGVSLEPERIPAFRRVLGLAVSAQTAGLDLTPEIRIDAYLQLTDISLDLVTQINQMAPFGPGNPAPLFACRNLTLQSSSVIDRRGEHLRMLVEDTTGHAQHVLWWQGAGSSLPEGVFDLAFTVSASNYRGQAEASVHLAAFRPSPQAPVNAGTRKAVNITDMRGSGHGQPNLADLALSKNALVWREGEAAAALAGCGRYDLTPARELVIYSIPPSHEILRQAVDTVKPEVIYLLAGATASGQPRTFLNRLAGLVNYAFNHRNSRARLADLAVAMAQREITVLKGLDYLSARGQIVYIWEGQELAFVRGGVPETENLVPAEQALKKLLEHAAAYRAFYLRADAKAIIDWL